MARLTGSNDELGQLRLKLWCIVERVTLCTLRIRVKVVVSTLRCAYHMMSQSVYLNKKKKEALHLFPSPLPLYFFGLIPGQVENR